MKLHALEADQLGHTLRKIAQTADLGEAERQSLIEAARMLLRQAATIALIRGALGEE